MIGLLNASSPLASRAGAPIGAHQSVVEPNNRLSSGCSRIGTASLKFIPLRRRVPISRHSTLEAPEIARASGFFYMLAVAEKINIPINGARFANGARVSDGDGGGEKKILPRRRSDYLCCPARSAPDSSAGNQKRR